MAGAADQVFADLRAEGEELDALLADTSAAQWSAPTPASGWTVAHQIAHLAWTDRRALLAVRDEAAFRREVEEALAALPDGGSLTDFVDEGAAQGAADAPHALLARWRVGRLELARALAEVPGSHRIPWYGPPMGAAGMATARLMETWAHGEDVAAALGVRREPTVRLRHVAWLGVRTRDFAYAVRGLEPPGEPFRVELSFPGPEGDEAAWAYGPEDAGQRVTGPAPDFCLLVTQRVHRGDTALRAEGADAERWLDIAQAFAGPPGAGRKATTGGAR
ncbi:TIGR03084 family protein [Streptomyces sp. RKND-216]|uniref:TIGR03084 family metal-binding protein n=1 Tax=Streptomyces sp. RKND-216 TaxID=2562581 RepID=UPI00109DDF2F|nr:TIGR03084 family metal-binding protein [Streptomyces sp. RKND-216]THA25861.1 TIGR03084 family protein [Streptomyces sp. RKND-216]